VHSNRGVGLSILRFLVGFAKLQKKGLFILREKG
jgi:hypothetical protein